MLAWGSVMIVRPCGEQAIIVDVTEDDAEFPLRTVVQLRRLVESWDVDGIVDLVPASTTLLIMLDTARVTPMDVAKRLNSCDLRDAPADADDTATLVEVPVLYDGPDLTSLATALDWSPEELVRRHCSTDWQAAFGGFAPGFTYLVAEDPLPPIPRLGSPRPSIPAGSVGLAGEFSGVYPQSSPGGWQLIGSTTAQMWAPERSERPALIKPGDRVRFKAVH